jgi:transcriptional regulator with XRE-family HTH domain
MFHMVPSMSTPQVIVGEWARAGAKVRRHRERTGMSAERLATAVGISRPYLSNIEAGRKRLTPFLAVKIAAVLGVSERTIVSAPRRAA